MNTRRESIHRSDTTIWRPRAALGYTPADRHQTTWCAEMAIEVLNGRRAASIPLATPRKVVYALNLRTAEHLKVDLPPEIVDGAQQVFR